MQFIKYSGSTMKCSYHNEKNNETFRGGGKFNKDEIIHSYQEQARKDCWFDFDYFYNVSLREFKEKWESMQLTYDELSSIADENNAIYSLLKELDLEEDYDYVASEYQQECVDSIKIEDN